VRFVSYQEIRGNIFAIEANALVNTVNCVGVMGRGVALEFRRRFPTMFVEYERVCRRGALSPGWVLPYRRSTPWVLNFAVKDHWRQPSRFDWVESCLRRFRDRYSELGITSAAFPWFGAMNGKLPVPEVLAMMRRYLEDLPGIEITVVEYDPDAPDPLFDQFLELVRGAEARELAKLSSMQARTWERIALALDEDVPSFARLQERAGLSITSMDKVFAALMDRTGSNSGDPQVDSAHPEQLAFF